MSEDYSNTIDYFVRSYTLIIDNDQGAYESIVSDVRNIIAGTGVTASEYKGMTDEERRENYAQSIGEFVLESVQVWCQTDRGAGAPTESIGQAILDQVMMYSDSFLAWRLGDHYMPENADIEDFLSDEDSDDE